MDRFLSLVTAILLCGVGVVPVAYAQSDAESRSISRETLYEKTYGYWLGQTVGNIYGLVHENEYVEEPGPRDFPYGYDYRTFDDGTTTESSCVASSYFFRW